MPVEVTWEPDGVFLDFSGDLTEDEMSEAARAVFEHPQWPSCEYYIADASDAEFEELTLDGLRAIAEQYYDIAMRNENVSGVVILDGLIERTIAKTYAAMSRRWSLYVADDEEDAREQLGLDPADFV